VQGGWANYTVPERTRYPLPFDGTNQQPSKLGKASFITLRFVLSLSGKSSSSFMIMMTLL
jgi:hypothetical protein